MRPQHTIVKNVLTPDECDEIIETYKPWLKQGEVGGGPEAAKKIRKSSVAFVTRADPLCYPLVKKAQDVVHDVTRTVHQTWIKTFQFAQVTEYKPFGFYKVHQDVAHQNSMRTVSAVLELSNPDDYYGGGTKTYINGLKGQKHRLEQGSILIFPSMCLHEALPVWYGTRYSLVIWGEERLAEDLDPTKNKLWARKQRTK